jgi:GT2 family glycosyltransferase
MNNEPRIGIIIVNWNGIRDTVECISSLKKIPYRNFIINVVDNNSTVDEASKLKELFPFINIIRLNQNIGFANANNVGIIKALQKGVDYILLLNNDTVVHSSFLNELVLVSETDEKIGIAGPKMYYYSNRSKIWYGGGKLNMYLLHSQRAGKIDIGQFCSVEDIDYVAGACMLIKRVVIEKIGLLPREYFLGWEDIDYCIAARKNGFRCVFVPNSLLWHKVSESYKRHNITHRQVFFGFRNRTIIRYKYLSKPKFVLFLIAHFLLVIPIHIVYYSLIYKDIYRITNLFKGLAAGFRDMQKRSPVYRLDY